jgi:hypothetical protein
VTAFFAWRKIIALVHPIEVGLHIAMGGEQRLRLRRQPTIPGAPWLVFL